MATQSAIDCHGLKVDFIVEVLSGESTTTT